MNRKLKWLTASGALLLAACSSAPVKPALTPLQNAQLEIARADEVRAGDYAAQDMQNARERLALARGASAQALQTKDAAATLNARQYSEEAIADAQLAVARAQAARVQAAVFALQQRLNPVAPLPSDNTMPSPDALPDNGPSPTDAPIPPPPAGAAS